MWKTMCILIVENYALFEALLRTITWESAFQLALRNCSKEVKEEPGYSGIFTGRKKKTHAVKHQKITAGHKNRHLKLKILVFFFAWEDASQSVQLLSRIKLFVTPRTAAYQASLSITNARSLLKLMSIKLVMPSNHLTLCHPFLLLPSIFPSIRVFSNESVLHIRWPKDWSFSLSISPPNEYSGLISFRTDWLDLLAVQRTLKSLLQCHSSKASVLWHLAFVIGQLSYPYMITGKTIALTINTSVSNGVSAF